MLNSVGLQNGGVKKFLEYEMPNLVTKDTRIIANIAGATVEECAELASMLEGSAVDLIELNISCPNVKAGGAAFGTDCTIAGQVTRAVKDATSKPLMVKLSPNVTSITDIAKSVEANGADAVSLINTLLGMRIDIKTGRPILKNNVGGLSGPAVFPVAVRMVWQVANAVNIPVMGMGGVATWEDAVEIMMAGASAVQVGAAIFNDPYAPIKIIDGLEQYCIDNNIDNISQIVGTVKPW
jgi:dihydroorotate dehydrogenase (NAD+) catalytic subunit